MTPTLRVLALLEVPFVALFDAEFRFRSRAL
jgi:hypothetical protein